MVQCSRQWGLMMIITICKRPAIRAKSIKKTENKKFRHSSLPLYSNVKHKTAVFPGLQKLTNIKQNCSWLLCYERSLGNILVKMSSSYVSRAHKVFQPCLYNAFYYNMYILHCRMSILPFSLSLPSSSPALVSWAKWFLWSCKKK